MTPAQVTLPPAAASVPRARRFVCDSLRHLDAAAACDDAEALVSELATNVVLHARTSFTVEVSRAGQTVRVCVLDSSPVQPRVRHYGTEATTGRGMRLVASLSAAWGVQPQAPGKTVWFELPADGNTEAVTGFDDEEVDVEALLASFGDDVTGHAKVSPRARVA